MSEIKFRWRHLKKKKKPTPCWFGRGEAGSGLGLTVRIYARAGPGAGRQLVWSALGASGDGEPTLDLTQKQVLNTSTSVLSQCCCPPSDSPLPPHPPYPLLPQGTLSSC